MKTILRRFLAGATITIMMSAIQACSPVVYAPSRPRPVVHVVTPPPPPEPVYVAPMPPPPVQTVVVHPVIPVWAPPYTYVTEVHYYYFPDYMVYYDVFSTHYVYYNGYSWLNVAVLPGLPMYHGFSPYNSYIVVLDRYASNPWARHSYYQEQYPRDYYKSAYAPRQSLNNSTVLRAYDENQRKPLFVDRKTNREVKVDYTVSQTPRGSLNNQTVRSNTTPPVVRNSSVGQNQRGETNTTTPVRNGDVNPRVNNNTVQNQVNPRGQASDNSNPAPRIQPNAPQPTGRGNVIRGQNETVGGNNNVAPQRSVTPVRSSQTNRSEQRVVPQTQVSGSRSQASPASPRTDNNVQPRQNVGQGNSQSVDARQSNPVRQRAQGAR